MEIRADPAELDRVIQTVRQFSPRRFKSAVATALTRTAKQARNVVRDRMPSYIDRPVPYTQKGFFFQGANQYRMTAFVFFGRLDGKGSMERGKYLTPQIEGGGRKLKRFEKALIARGSMPPTMFAVPAAGAKLDEYGNPSRGQLNQILSQVGTELAAGFSRTLRKKDDESAKQFASRKRRALGRAGGQYFAVPERRGKLGPGIYLAGGRDFGAKLGYGRNGRLVKVFSFVHRVSYRERFPFHEIVAGVVKDRLMAELDVAVQESAARLAARTAAQNT